MSKNTGLKRILYASKFSFQGFKSALHNETAFKQELMVIMVLIVISFFLDVRPSEQLLLIAVCIPVLVVEVLNSAIECVVDRIGTESHVLSGRAKDYGSLAVLLTILFALLVWVSVLCA